MASESQPSSPGPARDVGETGPHGSTALNQAEQALDDLLRAAHRAGGHDLPDLLARYAAALGCHDTLAYLTDLQQRVLVPFLPPRVDLAEQHPVLGVDSTVAGRAFQLLQIQTQDVSAEGEQQGRTQVWLPLLDGTERLGVLGVTVEDPALLEADDGLLIARLQRLASLAGELVTTKTQYGDTLVRMRRTARMGLAAEIQWSLLPPVTYVDEAVTVAGGLEPAYTVAGDSLDYAVDADVARFAVFDGMGHGLRSAQLTSLAVAAYRNARRSGLSLVETAEHVDSALSAIYRDEAFATALLGELDTVTGLFSWLSAGHPEPLVLRGGRAVRILEVVPTLPFGLGRTFGAAGTPATVGFEQLQPGDLLLLYTDGVTEARSPEGDFFGLDRLIDLVVRNLAAGLPAPETMRRVVRALLEHQSGNLSDDATLLLVQWHGNPSGSLRT
jgi:serine phosphatase RsbU (regulator of sigma subunit)